MTFNNCLGLSGKIANRSTHAATSRRGQAPQQRGLPSDAGQDMRRWRASAGAIGGRSPKNNTGIPVGSIGETWPSIRVQTSKTSNSSTHALPPPRCVCCQLILRSMSPSQSKIEEEAGRRRRKISQSVVGS